MFSQINNFLYGIRSSVNPLQRCKHLPCIADLIAVMALTKICPAYDNPVGGKSTHGKGQTWCLCMNTSHTSLHHMMPVTPETHRSRSSGPPSMIKFSKWWPTAFHWNGPPPDINQTGSNSYQAACPAWQGVHKILIRKTKTKTTWSGLKNRRSRKPDAILTATSWTSWILPLTSMWIASTPMWNPRERMVAGCLYI